MSAHLLAGDQVLKLPSARIARSDVMAISSASELLQRAKDVHEKSESAAQLAQDQGYERGQSQATDEMRDALVSAIEHLSADFKAENERREQSVAKAAMAVIERLIDTVPDADVVHGLAVRALAQCGVDSGSLRVCVCPDWVDSLVGAFGKDASIEVVGDSSLGRFGCRVLSGDGRIIADLETQLASLRQRWGLAESSVEQGQVPNG